jgi:outer membrane protein TolC
MKWTSIGTLALLVCSVVIQSQAQARRVSYEEAVSMAVDGHPELQSLYRQADAISDKASQSLAPANPTFYVNRSDSYTPQPFNQSGGTSLGASISLGFPGKAFVQRRTLRHQSTSIQHSARAKEIEIISQLSDVYVGLSANARLIGVYGEEHRRLQRLIPVIQERIKVGQGSEVDVLSTKTLEANLGVEIEGLKSVQGTLLAQFRQLVNKPTDFEVAPLIPKHINIPPIAQSSLSLTRQLEVNRPELKSAAARRRSAESALTQAKMAPLPDFQLSGQVTNYHAPAMSNLPGYQTVYGFMGGITVPLFYPASERLGIRAAKHELAAAQKNEETELLVSVTSLQAVHATLQVAQNQLRQYSQRVLPLSKSNYDLALTSYSLGKLDYARLQEIREDWLRAERGYVAKQLEAARLFNQLIRTMGCDPSHASGDYACQ